MEVCVYLCVCIYTHDIYRDICACLVPPKDPKGLFFTAKQKGTLTIGSRRTYIHYNTLQYIIPLYCITLRYTRLQPPTTTWRSWRTWWSCWRSWWSNPEILNSPFAFRLGDRRRPCKWNAWPVPSCTWGSAIYRWHFPNRTLRILGAE